MGRNNKLSVIIPARNEKFLQQTIDDIFTNATGDIEIVAVLDSYWPDPVIRDEPRLTLLHYADLRSMRGAINAGARIARGKYLMKCDAHCAFGKGFDEVLKADCEDDWIVVPTKYSLDSDSWLKADLADPPVMAGRLTQYSAPLPDYAFKYPTNYYYLTFPWNTDRLYGTGLHAKQWLEKEDPRMAARKEIMVDDLLSFQGSCWFMPKAYFESTIGPMDAKSYNFHQEAQELANKCWLSGGRVVVNKNTWYAHLHKGKVHGRGYYLSSRSMIESEKYSTDLWMNDKWPGAIHKFKWLVEKFWPMPGWPDDWEDPKYQEAYKHPEHGSRIPGEIWPLPKEIPVDDPERDTNDST
jgi:glycosyltransferase involved in cell wall biosynthesis